MSMSTLPPTENPVISYLTAMFHPVLHFHIRPSPAPLPLRKPSSPQFPRQQRCWGGHPSMQPQPLPQQPLMPGQQERLPWWSQLSAIPLCARYDPLLLQFTAYLCFSLNTAAWLSVCVYVCVCLQAVNWARPLSFWCSRTPASRCRLALVLLGATRCAAVVPVAAWRTVWRCPVWTSTSLAS